MSQAFDVEITLQQEPWRGLQGQPQSAIDPRWTGNERPACESTAEDIEWEGESGWWWCTKCGYCSNVRYLTHRKPQDPKLYLKESIELFKKVRQEQGLDEEDTRDQMRHAMGIVLREAAALPPNEFARYIAECIQR